MEKTRKKDVRRRASRIKAIGFEDSLLKEINKKAKVLKMTRAGLVRNALMEYLFRFDDILDAKMLAEAMEKDEGRRSLQEIAKELKLSA